MTRPRLSSSTSVCQTMIAMAVFCIQVPMSDSPWPAKNSE
jgi:hypothetical protein